MSIEKMFCFVLFEFVAFVCPKQRPKSFIEKRSIYTCNLLAYSINRFIFGTKKLSDTDLKRLSASNVNWLRGSGRSFTSWSILIWRGREGCVHPSLIESFI